MKLVLQLLGSSGGAGHRKQLRALAKDAEKKARAAAAAAKEARMSQPEPLSPEFDFVVRLRDRCAAGLLLALRSREGRTRPRPCMESRQRSATALTIGQLRQLGTSGMLLKVLLQLSCDHSCLSSASANMCSMMLARVSSGQATPEVCCVSSATAPCSSSLFDTRLVVFLRRRESLC